MKIEGTTISEDINPVSEEELKAFEQKLLTGVMFNTHEFLKRIAYTLRIQRTEIDMLYYEANGCVERIQELENRAELDSDFFKEADKIIDKEIAMTKKPFLTLADVSGNSQQEIKDHIANVFSDSYDRPDTEIADFLKGYDIIVACEDEGGYDGSNFFLIRHTTTGEYMENHAGHCSCNGYEGLWNPETTSVVYLRSGKFNAMHPYTTEISAWLKENIHV